MAEDRSSIDDGNELACDEALPAGTVLLNGQYTIERYLSNGGFGITYFARDSLDRRVVVKECYPEAFCSRKNRTVLARSRSHQKEFKSVVEMFIREAHSIAKLKHPNIVGVHQIFEDNETAYMALDLIDGVDLLETIELGEHLMSPNEVKSLLLKVLDAVSAVHDQDMLHRDISPDNILIDAWGNPILIDFGAAREEASKKSRALSAVLVVKDGYSPQEFYIAGSQQTPCSDLYALAATFSHLISGDPPPNSQSRLAAIASGQPDPYQSLTGRIDGYEAAFLEAIDTAMNVFPHDRIQTARDWILRIDDAQRREAALEVAKKDAEIENTVIQFIKFAQHEVTPVVKTPEPEPQAPAVAEPKREPEILLPEEPEPRGAQAEASVPVIETPKRVEPVDMIAKVRERNRVTAPKSRRPIKRSLAKLVLFASLVLFLIDGQTAKFANVIGPLVQQHITQPGYGSKEFG